MGHPAIHLKREDANEIAKRILPEYEHKFDKPPAGKTFQQCYDSEKLIPSIEWKQLYESTKREARDFGIPLE